MIGKPMTSGKPWLHILKFTIPVLAGSLLQQLYQTADTVIVVTGIIPAAITSVSIKQISLWDNEIFFIFFLLFV